MKLYNVTCDNGDFIENVKLSQAIARIENWCEYNDYNFDNSIKIRDGWYQNSDNDIYVRCTPNDGNSNASVQFRITTAPIAQ